MHATSTGTEFPLTQTFEKAHKLGCHHLAISANGLKLASAGFEGQAKLWTFQDDKWTSAGEVLGDPTWRREFLQLLIHAVDHNGPGEIWAIALSEDGQFLAGTAYDGRINVWDTLGGCRKIREYETKGSFGMSIDLVRPSLAASRRDRQPLTLLAVR